MHENNLKTMIKIKDMRIVAIADLHGEELVLDRLRIMEEKKDFDYLFIAGDIGSNLSYAEELSEIITDAYYVPGNSDNKEVVKIMEKAGFLAHKKTFELKEGLKLAGFGYTNITPFGTPGEIKEEIMKKELEELYIDQNTIFLTHCPPYGVLDNVSGLSIGCKPIRHIIEEKKPFLHIFGHVHEIIGKQRFKDTLCINLPPAYSLKAAYIEIKEKHVEIFISDF